MDHSRIVKALSEQAVRLDFGRSSTLQLFSWVDNFFLYWVTEFHSREASSSKEVTPGSIRKKLWPDDIFLEDRRWGSPVNGLIQLFGVSAVYDGLPWYFDEDKGVWPKNELSTTSRQIVMAKLNLAFWMSHPVCIVYMDPFIIVLVTETKSQFVPVA